MDQANSQITHTLELEILDSFHNSSSTIYEAIQSQQMNDYFSAKSDQEAHYGRRLKDYLLGLSSSLPYKDVQWVIFNARGHILLSTHSSLNAITPSKQNLKGASFDKASQKIILSLPLYSNSFLPDAKSKNTYGYLTIQFPLKSLQALEPRLIGIDEIPLDLSALKFKAQFHLPQKSYSYLYLFYFYIFVFVVFNFFAVFYGIKLLQNKIIEKLNSFTLRVLNDIQTIDKKEEILTEKYHLLTNEIDSLSSIFFQYMKYVRFLQKEVEKSSQLAAVGNIANNLAHDLRKPFSNAALFVDQVERIHSLAELKLLVEEYKPILKNSTLYLEHLLKEIMEAGVSRLNLSGDVKLEDILLKSLLSYVKLSKPGFVEIEYELKINTYLKVDELRVVRIFSNLILNALEAMNFSGKIWIKAVEKAEIKMIEIIFGNDGSYISAGDIKNLFEPFFTKNKKNGTGLGLSIAQKIIHLHGGQIICRSQKELGVEFVLTLPMGEGNYESDINLLPPILKSDAPFMKENENGFSSQVPVQSNLAKNIIVLDDDPFVSRSWKRLATDAHIIGYYSCESFLHDYKENKVLLHENSILVSDFYFGKDSKMDFYEFIMQLRKNYLGPIFLATDAPEEEVNGEFLKKFNVIKIEKMSFSFFQLFSKYLDEIENRKAHHS